MLSSNPQQSIAAQQAQDVSVALWDYLIDASQRTWLFWDVMRERGNQFIAHESETVPNVLSFDCDLVFDGRSLPQPVNYGLVRVKEPDGVTTDPNKRPFIVIDPRAGHGPGIGGFKADSEIGYAMRAGHPTYFIGFLPQPMAGQTIEDVMRAEVAFIERVIELHPDAAEKPAVIGNCQAGWALMMLAAYRPDLCGPIIVPGAPLSYWAGVRGKNPMRYSGGLLGGSWLTSLTSDLGGGTFDGAWLVSNFESLNPANTLWTKQYNLYKSVDTERERYLGFERYWGGYVLLNADEIQFIVDNLFVGNKLATGDIETSDGVRLDFRQIRSPILCFCSEGDNITPPQQALGWILDLYDDIDDIRASGQTIIYSLHASIGHLGIFVSGGVAKKQYQDFTANIDLLDCLPPGLYEAILTPKSDDTRDADLVETDYVLRVERRTLDDVRALGGNDAEDERRFATAAKLSEVNRGVYKTLAQPYAKAAGSIVHQDMARQLHPSRLVYTMLSDRNPWMSFVRNAAEQARAQRKPVSPENTFWQAQERVSDGINMALDGFRDARDAANEAWFLWFYGNPLVQAAVGMKADDGPVRRAAGMDPAHRRFVENRIAELTARMDEGGLREAIIRAIIYIGRPAGAADERRFALLQRAREKHDISLDAFKQLVRDQYLMLVLDEERAINALPQLLKADPARVDEALEFIRKIVTTAELPTDHTADRLREIEQIFGEQSVARDATDQSVAIHPISGRASSASGS